MRLFMRLFIRLFMSQILALKSVLSITKYLRCPIRNLSSNEFCLQTIVLYKKKSIYTSIGKGTKSAWSCFTSDKSIANMTNT